MRSQFKSLAEFSQEIERREFLKEDYVVNSSALRMYEDKVLGIGEKRYEINDYAHGQIATRLGIPKAYYDTMSQIPFLRTQNVNSWMEKKNEARMVRTLDGKVRAFLSDRFRPYDHHDILQKSVFPALVPYKDAIEIKASAISDQKMFLQIMFKDIFAEVKVGDIVNYCPTFTNSEVGAGSLDVQASAWRKFCANGARIMSLLKKYHVGRKIGNDEGDYDFFKHDTIEKDLEAYQLRMRDVIQNSLENNTFTSYIDKLRGAVEDRIEMVTPVVKVVTRRFGIEQSHEDRMVENIMKEGNLNRYGLSNSITALAHSIESPDRQYDVEGIGSKIIELTPREWSLIIEEAKAA